MVFSAEKLCTVLLTSRTVLQPASRAVAVRATRPIQRKEVLRRFMMISLKTTKAHGMGL
jgi:hypothetical protein